MYMYYVILHVPYGNHRKMLGLTCLNKFLCMYMYMWRGMRICQKRLKSNHIKRTNIYIHQNQTFNNFGLSFKIRK